MEAIATISLRKVLGSHAGKRRKRALDYLRNKVSTMAKVDIGSVKISSDLNRLLNVHSGKHIKKVKIKVTVDKGIATVKPFEEQTRTSANVVSQSKKPDNAAKPQPKAVGAKAENAGSSGTAQEKKGKNDSQ